jgi:hypothetical protein
MIIYSSESTHHLMIFIHIMATQLSPLTKFMKKEVDPISKRF